MQRYSPFLESVILNFSAYFCCCLLVMSQFHIWSLTLLTSRLSPFRIPRHNSNDTFTYAISILFLAYTSRIRYWQKVFDYKLWFYKCVFLNWKCFSEFNNVKNLRPKWFIIHSNDLSSMYQSGSPLSQQYNMRSSVCTWYAGILMAVSAHS